MERDSDGRIVLGKGKRSDGRVNKKILVAGVAIAFVAIAVSGIHAVIAEGDNNQCNNQLNYGEDGYYEENNCNPFPNDDFPGLDDQNRTGVE